MIATSKWLAIVAVAFVVGSFIASSELRAFAANTVFSGDIVDGEVKTADLASNAVTAAKIKDGEVKTADIGNGAVNSAKISDNSITAADIATDAVGAAELQGVTKLLFAHCVLSNSQATSAVSAHSFITVPCSVTGSPDSDDDMIASAVTGVNCFAATNPHFKDGTVFVTLRNVCTIGISPGGGSYISILVFDK